MYDILIKDTQIADGTGKSLYKADIALKDSLIVKVGQIKEKSTKVINGSRLITCPGFIDPHSHIDMTLLLFPECNNLVMQGITSAVGGNCGMSGAPRKNITFEEFLSKIENIGISINYIPLIGHNNIRENIMGDNFKREASVREINEMKELLEEAMLSGAFGFSTMRDPSIGEYGNTEEVIELVRIVNNYGGIYASHHKHIQSQWASDDLEEYGYGIFHGPIEDAWVGRYKGLHEAFEIAKKTFTKLQISHLSNIYRIPQPHPEFLDEAVSKATLWNINEAIREGVNLMFDIIPNTSSISALTPIINEFLYSRVPALDWLRKMDKEEFLKKIEDKMIRDRIIKIHKKGKLKLGMINTKHDPYWMDRFKILKSSNPDYENKLLSEISNLKNKEPIEVLFDLILEDPDIEWVQINDDRLFEKCVSVLLKHPLAMPCTDTLSLPPIDFPKKALKMFPKEHRKMINVPIFYGIYPFYIDTYVKKKKILKIEEAIKKATYLPAMRFGLVNRGIIKPNMYADLVIFDFEKIEMTGNFQNPKQAPNGIEWVIVNGEITYENNKHSGVKAGKVLRNLV